MYMIINIHINNIQGRIKKTAEPVYFRVAAADPDVTIQRHKNTYII